MRAEAPGLHVRRPGARTTRGDSTGTERTAVRASCTPSVRVNPVSTSHCMTWDRPATAHLPRSPITLSTCFPGTQGSLAGGAQACGAADRF